LESLMKTEYPSFDDVHPSVEIATHTIARFSSWLAALLFVAGDSHAPHRALPASSKTAHSGASN
jgi:hypothetical protein